MTEEETFWMLDIITKTYLPGVHEVNLEGVNIDQGVLMLYLKELLPNVWEKLGTSFDGQHSDDFLTRLPPISLCTSAWFMSAYVNILPPETLLRVWDCMFYEGPRVLFRVALAIFKLCEPMLKDLTDQMEMFQIIQNFPKTLVDPNEFLDICFRKIDPIKNEGELRQFVAARRKQEGHNNTDVEAYKEHRLKEGKSSLSLNFHLKHQLRSITIRRHKNRSASARQSGNLGRRITSFQRKSMSLRSSAASTTS